MPKRRAKIVCTLGPATTSPDQIEALIDAGADLIRLNFAHGHHREHGAAIKQVRLLSEKKEKSVSILQDIQGSKIRVGPLQEPSYLLKKGALFTLLPTLVIGNKEAVSTSHGRLYQEVFPHDLILLNDGQITLRVIRIHGKNICCRVMEGGILASNKGVNVPGRELSVPALTEKDRKDLAFGLDAGVDFIALSMVRNAKEVLSVKRLIQHAGKTTSVIAKLEMAVAIQKLDEILKVADGVMVARGDLGVDLPLEQVPLTQKEIIRRANVAQVPVITATQMLESMVVQARPTRAEASDVANAVLDGTDALMLSAETAIGAHPIEAVRMMARIIVAAESQWPKTDTMIEERHPSVSVAISRAACLLARETKAKAIVTSTLSGKAALRVSKYRPQVSVIAFTPFLEIKRRMSLYWGVEGRLIQMHNSTDDIFKEMIQKVCAEGFAKRGDRLVLISQSLKEETTPTDLIKVYHIP
jgi:pyruvate kinase